MSDPQPQKIIDQSVAPVTRLEQEQAEAAEEFLGQKNGTNELSMAVKVHSPFKDYYDGPAFSISAENATGPFDILPRHHNFITLLSPCDVMVRTVGKGDQKIRISGGIMHVKADKVIVFLDV
ncbi:MAG: atpC [Candidatus Saccharibacteria bacterium]|nr:atpC [Candidatus Saccharibacteria bacterium]